MSEERKIFSRKLEIENTDIPDLLKYFREQQLIDVQTLIRIAWLRESRVFKAEYLQKSTSSEALTESSKSQVYAFLSDFPDFRFACADNAVRSIKSVMTDIQQIFFHQTRSLLSAFCTWFSTGELQMLMHAVNCHDSYEQTIENMLVECSAKICEELTQIFQFYTQISPKKLIKELVAKLNKFSSTDQLLTLQNATTLNQSLISAIAHYCNIDPQLFSRVSVEVLLPQFLQQFRKQLQDQALSQEKENEQTIADNNAKQLAYVYEQILRIHTTSQDQQTIEQALELLAQKFNNIVSGYDPKKVVLYATFQDTIRNSTLEDPVLGDSRTQTFTRLQNLCNEWLQNGQNFKTVHPFVLIKQYFDRIQFQTKQSCLKEKLLAQINQKQLIFCQNAFRTYLNIELSQIGQVFDFLANIRATSQLDFSYICHQSYCGLEETKLDSFSSTENYSLLFDQLTKFINIKTRKVFHPFAQLKRMLGLINELQIQYHNDDQFKQAAMLHQQFRHQICAERKQVEAQIMLSRSLNQLQQSYDQRKQPDSSNK